MGSFMGYDPRDLDALTRDDTYRPGPRPQPPKPTAQVEARLPRSLGKRVWGHELLVAEGPGYIGKVLYMKAGTAGGLQRHVEKDETSFLFSGEALLVTDTGDGVLTEFRLTPGAAIHIPPGAVHQVKAVTDCVFFEASTPHFDDRVRLEQVYGLEDTGGLRTTR